MVCTFIHVGRLLVIIMMRLIEEAFNNTLLPDFEYGDKLGIGAHLIDTTDENAIEFKERPIQQPLSGKSQMLAQTQGSGHEFDYRGITEELSISRLVYSQNSVVDLDHIWLGSAGLNRNTCTISNGRYSWGCFKGSSSVDAGYQNQITSGRPMKYQGQYSYSTALDDGGRVTGTTIGRAFSHLVFKCLQDRKSMSIFGRGRIYDYSYTLFDVLAGHCFKHITIG